MVALLSPLPADATPIDALIAGGRATSGIGSLSELGLPPGLPSNWATATLRAIRDEEPY